MKQYFIFIFILGAGCSSLTVGKFGDTLGVDGNDLYTDISSSVQTSQNRAFLKEINVSWGAGPSAAFAKGNTFNARENITLNNTVISDSGRAITVSSYSGKTESYGFVRANSASEAFYTNIYTHTVGTASFSVVRTVGIKIEPDSTSQTFSLILAGYKNNTAIDTALAAVRTQADLDALAQTHWVASNVDFAEANYLAYLGGISPTDELFLRTVNIDWLGVNNTAPSAPFGNAISTRVTGQGRTITVEFADVEQIILEFDSSKNATEGFYRQVYTVKNVPITRLVGVKKNATSGNLEWYYYQNRSTVDEALEALGDSAAAVHTFNSTYQTRDKISFNASDLYTIIAAPLVGASF